MPIRLIATSVALTAFAAAVLGGIVAQNPATVVLGRALVVMLACYVAGLVIGAVVERALREQIDRYKQEHPLPSEHDATDTDAAAQADTHNDTDPSSQEKQDGAASDSPDDPADRSPAAA